MNFIIHNLEPRFLLLFLDFVITRLFSDTLLGNWGLRIHFKFFFHQAPLAFPPFPGRCSPKMHLDYRFLSHYTSVATFHSVGQLLFLVLVLLFWFLPGVSLGAGIHLVSLCHAKEAFVFISVIQYNPLSIEEMQRGGDLLFLTMYTPRTPVYMSRTNSAGN